MPSTSAEWVGLVAGVEPGLTREQQFLRLFVNVRETVTSGHKQYKDGAFSKAVAADTPTVTTLRTYINSPLITTIEKMI
jgi:hypothetical protein